MFYTGDITAHTGEIIADINRSFGGTNVQTTEKGERMAQLLQEAHIAKRERDDAVFRLEQVIIILFICSILLLLIYIIFFCSLNQRSRI